MQDRNDEMLEIERVLHSIELILDGRHGDDEFTQERAASYCCLTSAAVLLGVTQRLMSQPAYLSSKDRVEHLRSFVEDIKTAARAAYRAELMLTDIDPCFPATLDVSRRPRRLRTPEEIEHPPSRRGPARVEAARSRSHESCVQ